MLDLGTGTGVLARQFAVQGCEVSACDIAADQIAMAKTLADKQNLDIDFTVQAAEQCEFPAQHFDVITANQCFLYFDITTITPLIAKWLKPDGVLVISHFSWLPRLDAIAEATEALILQYNPAWSAHGYAGETAPRYPGPEAALHYCGYFYYDENITFSREDWRGRIRASRGIGASLSDDEVAAFDNPTVNCYSALLVRNLQYSIVLMLTYSEQGSPTTPKGSIANSPKTVKRENSKPPRRAFLKLTE